MFSLRNLVYLFIVNLPLGDATPLPDTHASHRVPGKYIVTLKDGINTRDVNLHMRWVRDLHNHGLGRREIKINFAGVEKTYDVGSFNAYAGHFDEETLGKIRKSTEVAHIEQQTIYYPHGLAAQKNSTYGLASISHRDPGSTEYVYDESAAAGATVYVLDTGIQVDHPEFEGRASHGYNAVNGTPDGDIMGHGTHVAGTVGGRTYGVAKKATLLDVKLFHDAGTTTEVILDGIEWAIKDITSKKIQKRAIINMSFGGGFSLAQNKIIKSAHDEGILCVISAGNEGVDAGNSSPASSPDGITVGAIDANWNLWEHSNYGSVVSILAPGVQVLSTYPGNTTASDSGTSMAAPHVAGLAAYLAVAENINSVKDLKNRILSLGTQGKAGNMRKGTVNLVSFNGNRLEGR